jgi:hypothetical protein
MTLECFMEFKFSVVITLEIDQIKLKITSCLSVINKWHIEVMHFAFTHTLVLI